MILPDKTISRVGIVASFAGGLLGFGCAGSSPQLATPTLTAPNPGFGAGGNPLGTAVTGAAAEAALPALEAVKTPKGTFLAAPYLQLGAKGGGKLGKTDTLTLVWQIADDTATAKTPTEAKVSATGETRPATKSAWNVETRPAGTGDWHVASSSPTSVSVTTSGVTAHHVFSATLTGLESGRLFDYRLLENGKPVFAARARARRTATDPYRFVVFGDSGANTKGQRKVAYQTSLAHPDFVFLTGDIVSGHGLASEYQTNFFPVYNAEEASAEAGAPLLRSTLFIGAPGSHDLEYHDLSQYPDGLAYFFYWDQPRNGPTLKAGSANTSRLSGPETAQTAFLAEAHDTYPRMANYSFEYGNGHWTVLDSNPYVDWSDPTLREWLEKDLKSAKSATWRFVAFDEPPFSSSNKDRDDQQMRVLCDLFEKYKVDVVWTGHVPNYQRTYPLTFVAEKGTAGKLRDDKNRVAGKWTLDTEFDGEKKAKPKGVLYIITGGGGGDLYDADIQQKPTDWQPFTAKYIADTHSFSQADISGTTLTVHQISEDGKDLDTFTVTK